MKKAFTSAAKGMVLVIGCQMLFACKTFDALTKKTSEPAEVQTAEAPVETRQSMKVHDEHFIPKQQYDAQGVKIPYVADANPYLKNKPAIDPQTRTAFNKALKLFKAKKLDQARKQFEALAEKQPKLSGIWVQIARIAEAKDDLPGAEKALQKAVEVNESNVAAYNALALVYRKQGKFDAAQNAYISALEQWPDFAEGHYNLGVLYDLYFNDPLAAQMHFEAYHFLTGGKNKKVGKWLVEIKRRSGVDKSFIDEPPAILVTQTADEEQKPQAEAL